MTKYIFLVPAFLVCAVVLGVNPDPTTPTTLAEVFEELLKLLGGWGGLTMVGIGWGITNVIMYAFRSPLAEFAGEVRFAIACGLNVVSVILGQLVMGAELANALFSAASLAAFGVFFNELKKYLPKLIVPLFGGGK